MSRFVLGVLFLATFGLTPAAVVSAQETTSCPTGQTPSFVLGFADLQAQIGAPMGDPVTCEFPDPNGTGDIHQRTTTGLAFWRKATNTPTFTDGFQHWGQTPTGLVAWTGTSVDPPAQASVYPDAVVTAFVGGCTRQDPSLDAVCRCAIDKIQSRYSLGDFLNVAQVLLEGNALPIELQNIVIDCVLTGCAPTPAGAAREMLTFRTYVL